MCLLFKVTHVIGALGNKPPKEPQRVGENGCFFPLRPSPKADLETTRELGCSPLSSGLKTMTSSPITSWQIDGETVRDFIFLGSKIIVDGDCSHEIKRHSLLGRKAMTNLDSILKSRDITLLKKVCIVKAMVLPVVIQDVRIGP